MPKKVEANNQSLEMETTQPEVSAKAVKRKSNLLPTVPVFAQADLFIERLRKDKRYNQLQAEETRVKYL